MRSFQFLIVLIFFQVDLFAQGFGDQSTEWIYQRSIPVESTMSSHGLAFDGNGNIWNAPYHSTEIDGKYMNPIYCYTPLGDPCESVGKIYKVETGDSTLYFGPTTGIASDENGDILASVHGYRRSDNLLIDYRRSFIVRIDHNTGDMIDLGEITELRTETSSHSFHIDIDASGNIYYSTVFPNEPIRVMDSNFNYLKNISDSRPGFARSIIVNSDGSRVYQPLSYLDGTDKHNILIFNGSLETGYSLIDSTTFSGMDSGAGGICPQSGIIYLAASGISTSPQGDLVKWNPYTIYGFLIDEQEELIYQVDELEWTNNNESINPIYRAFSISPDGRKLAVGSFHSGGEAFQLFSRETIPDFDTFRIPDEVKLMTPPNSSENHSINLTLQWEPVELRPIRPMETMYEIQVSEGADMLHLFLDIVDYKEIALELSNLKYETTYFWRIRANIGGYVGEWSEIWSFTTLLPTEAPTLTAPEDGADNQPRTLTLQWEALEFSDTYGVQVSENPDMMDAFEEIVNFTELSYELSGLTFENTYYWRVNATNDAGTSEWSEIWSFTTESAPVPEPVELISPANAIIPFENSITFQWKPALPYVDDYIIEIAKDYNFDEITQNHTTNQTRLDLSNIDVNQKKYWRVKADFFEREGPYSEVSSFYITNRFISTNGEILSGVSSLNEDVFFTSSKDDRVYSFDRTGRILWTVETGGALQSTIAVDQNGDIFVGSTDTRLYSFDKDGIPRWDRALGGTILSSPSIGNDDLLYVGISTGRFFAVSKSDGNIEWSIQTDDEIVSSASVDSDGIVYFGSNDGNLYSVDQTGQLLWSYLTDGAVTGSPALSIDGEIVFPSQDGSLYKLDNSGDLLWKFETDGAISSSPVINSNGTILFGSDDGNVYSVSEYGELKWSYEIGSPVNGTPALTADGLLVIGSDDGKISVFNTEGELIRQLRTGGSIKAPMLINENNSIHVSSTDGYVYILENLVPDIMSKQLLSSELPIHQWSTFKGNNRRTGNQADIIDVSADNPQVEDLPTVFELQQNYPNPFNPSTIISYSLPEQTNVRIDVFNSLGQRVAILVDESKSAGRHEVTFDAKGLSSGLYLYRLTTPEFTQTRVMNFIK